MKKFILMALLCAPMTMFAQKFGHINSQEIMTAGVQHRSGRDSG